MQNKIRTAPSCFPANPLPPRSDLARAIVEMADALSERVDYQGLPDADNEWIHEHLKYSAETLLMHFDLLSKKRKKEMEEAAKAEADRTVETDSSAFRDAL